MIYFGVFATILSHVVASLYMQKQKYNKLVTAGFWILYAVLAVCITLFAPNIILGFFIFLVLHLITFYITSVGSVGENTFLFLTYANSFCIYIGVRSVLTAILGDKFYLHFIAFGVLVLIHIFLYKILVPTYNKAKAFFSSGWWKLNIILILFLIQFVTQYAFKIVDKNSANELIFDFAVFTIIFYSTLDLLFNSVRDVAEKNEKAIENDELKHVAYIDALTSMQNRSAYVRFIKRQVLNHKNNSGTSFSFVIMDVDDFKHINDTKGHAAGDEILRQVGTFLTEYFEPFNCESFRIGGDEFVLLLEDMSLPDVEEQMKKMNEELFAKIGVTVSCGCTDVDFDKSKPFDSALKTADKIMYNNKQKKKSQA